MKTRSSLEKSLALHLEDAIANVTPGVVLQAHAGGALVCDLRAGQTSRYYDLASLTKIVFTQQALMQAFDRGLWGLESTVGDFLPDFTRPGIRLTALLTHTSGLEWWMPFYESVDRTRPWRERRQWLYRQLQAAPFAVGGDGVAAVGGAVVGLRAPLKPCHGVCGVVYPGVVPPVFVQGDGQLRTGQHG